MTEFDQNIEEPTLDAPEEMLWPSPGEKLRLVREEKGINKTQVAESLHLTVHYVTALENDEYQKLPGKVFIKGYFKSYATLLGVDVEEIQTCFENFCGARQDFKEKEAAAIRKRKANDQTRLWLILAAIIITVVVFFSWWLSRSTSEGVVQVEQQIEETEVLTVSEIPVEPELTEIINAEFTDAVLVVEEIEDSLNVDEEINESVVVNEESVTNETALIVENNVEELVDENLLITEVSETSVLAVSVNDTTETESSGQVIEAVTESSEEITVMNVSDAPRIINLVREGDDNLYLVMKGNSWIEVDNADNERVFNDMLEFGDVLSIQSKAPFNILIGDAGQVDLEFNNQAINLEPLIRRDNSARVILEP